jgi:hypothetical protein
LGDLAPTAIFICATGKTTLFRAQAPNILRAFNKEARLCPPKQFAHYLTREKRMFLGLGFILLLLWLGGFFVFHVTAFFIHILLILAVISVVFHFMRGATSAV